MNIKLVKDTIDFKDISNLIEWLKTNPRLTKSDLTLKFEREWSKWLGVKYSIFVNSGSSANLAGIYSLILSQRMRNKKIVVPAVSWVTTVTPAIQLGLDPIMCDCNLEDLSCDINHLETLFIEHSPSSFILVSPLGLVPNMKKIIDLCEKYEVILLEDVCESMGSKYDNKYLGSFGFASFFSMYFGHHLSTIEGGFINTNDTDFYYSLLMMRSHGWDRDLPKRIQNKLRNENEISEFDSLYTFYLPGFNLRSTDLQAFIGLRAIDKLDDYTQKRNKNFQLYRSTINNNQLSITDKETNFISNFAYPIVNKNRSTIIQKLIDNNIEVRPLIAGDMSKKPMWVKNYGEVILPNCQLINEYGFYIPNHQDLTSQEINIICNIINNVQIV